MEDELLRKLYPEIRQLDRMSIRGLCFSNALCELASERGWQLVAPRKKPKNRLRASPPQRPSSSKHRTARNRFTLRPSVVPSAHFNRIHLRRHGQCRLRIGSAAQLGSPSAPSPPLGSNQGHHSPCSPRSPHSPGRLNAISYKGRGSKRAGGRLLGSVRKLNANRGRGR